MVARTPALIYNDDTGESIAASDSYSTSIIDVSMMDEIKIYAKLTYHASATLGGYVDVIPIQPDGATAMSDSYVTAVTPAFSAGDSKDKLGSPIDVRGVNKIKLKVVNSDAAQAMTLKKLYIY